MKKRGCLARMFRVVVAGLLLLAAAAYGLFLYPFWGMSPQRLSQVSPPLTPAWALECWVWEDDENTAASTQSLLEDYRKNDIPVRTVLIDSPWSMRYNDFHVDEARFPEPEKFFRGLEAQNYRVVLWMTSMVNSRSKDTAIKEDTQWYQDALRKGFLVNTGQETRWWKGQGGLLDYTNPKAMEWWRGMQEPLFNWGVDGWKLDGTDPYALSWLSKVPVPYVQAQSGWQSNRDYADHYYRDEYLHGRTKNPEFVTLSRSLDSPLPWSRPWGYAPRDAAPVTWVGDNQHCWEDGERGLERALRLILDSAALGYNVIGSDVAGYHGEEPIAPEIYVRWTQFSTFCGLFLNGGHGERRMSRRTPLELELVRKFSWMHTELVPYMYSHTVECGKGGKPLMRPLKQGDYHYLFGDDFLVAPIYRNEIRRTVHVPEGRWRYWFNDEEVVEGPAVITRDFPLEEFPVYVRDGAIVPMHVERAYTGIGERDWESYLTLDIRPAGLSSFDVHHTDNSGTLAVLVTTQPTTSVILSGVLKPHILRIRAEQKPARIECNGDVLSEGTDWHYSPESSRIVIRSTQTVPLTYQIR